MIKQRNLYADFLKGILIISVAIGHSIQYLQYENNFLLFWNNYLFKAIYTFHMPLFMAVSGYFAYSSIANRTTSDFIKSRIKYLLIPLIAWCFIRVLCSSIGSDTTIITFFDKFIYTSFHSYWFVWTVILGSVVVCILKRFSLDKAWILLPVSILAMLLSTSVMCIHVGREYFIYFALGYILGSRDLSKYYEFCRKYFLVFVLILIPCCIVWNPFLPSSILSIEGWAVYLFRVFLGIISSIVFLIIFYGIYTKVKERPVVSYLSNIGQETLGIYLMHDFFIVAYQRWILPHFSLPLPGISYTILAFVIVAVSYSIIYLLKKNKIAGFVLLGKRI
ncbi:MAG: acyltransferase [Dysgonomonas sp.]|nr:acyltransferase [Dysgonomonas sp.]